ncbi:hypothetical protein [Endozoicomonas arenosclerae]|uniref:hypothetical protein n=1 Tax=Endozoicomonas arenosclerae TaxID=1633495 RepID=UPI0007807EB3|nr:hypothetical protein [Endozoicomonas arenosclerae]
MDILFTNDGNDLFTPGVGLTTTGKAFMGQFNSSPVVGVQPTTYVQQGQAPVHVRPPAPSMPLSTPVTAIPSTGPMLSGFNVDSGLSLTSPVLTNESGGDLFGFNFCGGSDDLLSGLINGGPVPSLPHPTVSGDSELERMAMELVNSSGISFEELNGEINPMDLLTTATSPAGSDQSLDSGVVVSPASFQTPSPSSVPNGHSVDETVEVTEEMIKQLANNPDLMDSLFTGACSLIKQTQVPVAPTPALETTEVEIPEPRPIAKAGKSKKPKSATYMGRSLEGVAEALIAAEAARKSPINGQIVGKQVTKEKLANMPVDDFNKMLDDNKLDDIDVAVAKEWRRRNKNKSAAQVARKRKRDEAQSLQEEVDGLKKEKKELEEKLELLPGEIKQWKTKAQALEKEALAKGDFKGALQGRIEAGDKKFAMEIATWLQQQIQKAK